MKIGAEWAVSLIFIMICTITDIRKREIPLTMIILFSCLSLVIAKIRGEEGGWFSFLYSMAPGVFFLLLSFCTRQSIGYGDVLVILVLGLYVGYRKCIMIVAIGLVASSVYALVLLVCRKVKGKSRIAFVPFLAIGWGVVYVAQKGM